MKIFKGISIFLIALIATTFFTGFGIVFSFIYHLFIFKWNTGLEKSGAYFYKMGLGIDQFGNISMSPLFNLIMFKSDISEMYLFGDEDDTISYVLAVNYYKLNLNSFGIFWSKFLNFVDKDHLKKAIENKKLKDKEAVERLKIDLWTTLAA